MCTGIRVGDLTVTTALTGGPLIVSGAIDGDGIATIAENADPNGDGDPRDALDSDRDGLLSRQDLSYYCAVQRVPCSESAVLALSDRDVLQHLVVLRHRLLTRVFPARQMLRVFQPHARIVLPLQPHPVILQHVFLAVGVARPLQRPRLCKRNVGIVVPAATPKSLVAQISRAIVEILETREVAARALQSAPRGFL